MKSLVCGNFYFNSYGLWVEANEYLDTEKCLYTTAWPEDLVRIRNAVEPEFGEIDLIEARDSSLIIYLFEADKKDVQNYASDVKKIYSNSLKSSDKKVIYTGLDEDNNKVTIEYTSGSKEAKIVYRFEK